MKEIKEQRKGEFMRNAAILFSAMLALHAVSPGQEEVKRGRRPMYDSLLAKQLGADDYGMKDYVMAFLKSGPVRLPDSVQRAELQHRHLRNILRLASEGKLIVAGPFLDDQAIRGIFIFNVQTVEEAMELAETDPAVKAGTLVLELHPWYGSAALLETTRIHKMIERKSVAD